MTQYLCIHGHFYQPPRENPWLEAIENQESAAPYHDWNERITEECYARNAASRIMNSEGKIEKIVNNYEKISFNFGPTLLSWIKETHPELLELIRDADAQSQQQFNGHGNALAQAYNHMIMPLANSRDKYTQLLWGIKDFEFYFNRKPEGLWLPETAVDLETLDMMSELGIQFTILAPNQLKQVRSLNNGEWSPQFSIDTPYVQGLPSGRSIVLFFYDGGVSKAVAFEKLLNQGEQFAGRLLEHVPAKFTANSLMHIATDGETYGHHHPNGDMGLAYALHFIEEQSDTLLTNYAHFLEVQAPEFEVEIYEDSSWSCIHGIERWRSDCGCNNGQGWHQQWRAPLRKALDWLRDELIPVFEMKAGELVHNPWDARDEYITVINDRTKLAGFLADHCKKELNHEEQSTVIKWLELQRHAMLMYTSCGWFFDEISGIENVQILKYAARVIQLAQELTQIDYSPLFREKLSLAPSNIPSFGHGANIYNWFVKPLCINLFKVSAHLAASLPFITYDDRVDVEIYSYKAKLINTRESISGKVRLISGMMQVASKITSEGLSVWYAVFYQGNQNLLCAIQKPDQNLTVIENSLHEAFAKGDTFEVIRQYDHHFGQQTISLGDLFYDMKLKISEEILATSLADLEVIQHQFFDNNAALIDYISALDIHLPKPIQNALISILNNDILFHLSSADFNKEQLELLLHKAKKLRVPLDESNIAFTLNKLIEVKAHQFDEHIEDELWLKELIAWLAFIKTIPVGVNFWHLQNKVSQVLNEGDELQQGKLLKELALTLDLVVH